ncbi:hypothetical protein GC170_14500 [bacterium]|nr:hypothetical protein [bacterium]
MKPLNHEQQVAWNVVNALREIASQMSGTGQYMQAIEENGRMVIHGREIEDAAQIALSWANEIVKEYDLSPRAEVAPIAIEKPIAMNMSDGGIGDKVMNFIISSGLLSTECPDAPESGCVTVWAANAAEQIEACIADLARQGTVPCPLCGHSHNKP